MTPSHDLTAKQQSDEISVSVKPSSVFDPMTGYLTLSDGMHRQVVARVDKGVFYIKYKRDGREYPLTLDDLMQAYLQSKTQEPESSPSPPFLLQEHTTGEGK
jgi:hypothetical protein